MVDITKKPIDEITLRLYERPSVTGRELVTKICLSLGLLQPQSSQDVIVDVLHTLILANKQKEWLSSKDIENQVIIERKDENLSLKGTASSNIRRILKQLTDFGIIEKIKAKYRMKEFKEPAEVFEEIIQTKLQKIISRNKDYLKRI